MAIQSANFHANDSEGGKRYSQTNSYETITMNMPTFANIATGFRPHLSDSEPKGTARIIATTPNHRQSVVRPCISQSLYTAHTTHKAESTH